MSLLGSNVSRSVFRSLGHVREPPTVLRELSPLGLNPILRGWYIYYGHFYPSALGPIWNNFNRYLVSWARRKYKRFVRHKRRAWGFLARFARANPDLFIHWRLAVFPWSLNDRSRMS